VTSNPGGPIVCVGDSLTSGVNPYGGYPVVLGQRVKAEVINLGMEGVTTENGVKMLAAVQTHLRQLPP
jgi:lysophospholipase L1-like esterase